MKDAKIFTLSLRNYPIWISLISSYYPAIYLNFVSYPPYINFSRDWCLTYIDTEGM